MSIIREGLLLFAHFHGRNKNDPQNMIWLFDYLHAHYQYSNWSLHRSLDVIVGMHTAIHGDLWPSQAREFKQRGKSTSRLCCYGYPWLGLGVVGGAEGFVGAGWWAEQCYISYVTEALRGLSNSHTPFFIPSDWILYRVFGVGESNSRCFLLAWS